MSVAGGFSGEWNKYFLKEFFLVPFEAQTHISNDEDAEAYWNAHRLDDPNNPLPEWSAPRTIEEPRDIKTMQAYLVPQKTGVRYMGLLAEPPVWATRQEKIEGVWTTVVDPWFVPTTNGGEPSAEDGYERVILSESGTTIETKTYTKTITWTVSTSTYTLNRVLNVTQDVIADHSRYNKIQAIDTQVETGTDPKVYSRNVYLDNKSMIGFGENKSSAEWSLKCYAIFDSEDGNKILSWGYLKNDMSAITVHGANQTIPSTDPPEKYKGEMPIFRKNNFIVTFGAVSDEIQNT